VPQTVLIELPGCGHSPQRDQPAAVIDAVREFVRRQAVVSDHAPHTSASLLTRK
jgi:hypothetical protein